MRPAYLRRWLAPGPHGGRPSAHGTTFASRGPVESDRARVGTPDGEGTALHAKRGGCSVSLPGDDLPISTDPMPDSAAGIAGLAHDLRAPLAAIHTATELLARDLDCLDETEIQQMVQTIHRGVRRFEQLTDNLHSFIALRGGRLPVNRAPLNLRELVEECA